ncbi:zona pellucida sperm-binding protein 3-like [Seriola aureovittata]|uniref:zona pellucida sperm-binding protein 3-like n=1 Tax=Seriola aureovittata TaxID=2871759 RepID=UPI0024BEB11E|nr:zona pellucida sperm-binding protein 3-like [Seriola aureovittata]
MVIAGQATSLVLLLLFAVADSIRVLKDGPMIDAEGREFKSAAVRTDAENIRRRQSSDGSTIRVQCTEVSMIIVVNADFYRTGRPVSAGDLFLGEARHSESSQCRAVAVSDTEYVIEAGLQNCGSNLSISEDSVTYSNKLIFSPAASYHGITRLTPAVVPVSCHYKRTHFVSSNTQHQPLTLSTSAQYPTERFIFSLKLMTDDWTSEMLPSVFYLGDLLHLEASYTGPDAGRRRLFIDSCVATLSPDVTSVPRYYFIENYGCVTDAKEGGSNTLFKPRTRSDSLQLQLDAFLFHLDPRNLIFITCQLKVTSETWKSSPINKACNYIHSRWKDVDGNVGVCQCCDSVCHRRSIQDMMVCGTVTLGPLMIFPSK